MQKIIILKCFIKDFFPKVFGEIIQTCYTESKESYKKIFTDHKLYSAVMEGIAREAYNTLRD